MAWFRTIKICPICSREVRNVRFGIVNCIEDQRNYGQQHANGRSTRYCHTEEKKTFQHLQSPRLARLICIFFKLVFSVLHTIPFKLPNIQQPLTLTACDFNILLETDFGEGLFVWYRNLEKEQNNQEHPMTDGSVEMFGSYLFYLKVLTHRAN